MDDMSALLTPVQKLDRDMLKAIKQGGGGVTDSEARYLVDTYYQIQKRRIRLNNQIKGLDRDAKQSERPAEPHSALDFAYKDAEMQESNVYKLLQAYTALHPMSWFFDQTMGIGPILSAGILAHIDIKKCPTAGHIWSFAGLVNDVIWTNTEGAKKIWAKADGASNLEKLVNAAKIVNRNPDRLFELAGDKLTEKNCIAAIAKKPFNSSLKTLCWKIGESFVKVSKREGAFYGRMYAQRKCKEWDRNLSGDLVDQANKKLRDTKIGKTTDAYAWYSGKINPSKVREALNNGEELKVDNLLAEEGKGLPMLPPAHIHARSTRYTVKIFLSHLQECWYRQDIGEPPNPFAVGILGHAHVIHPPQTPPADKV